MGLDMYLTEEHYVEGWDHQPEDQRWKTVVMRGGEPVPHINSDKVTHVTCQVAYWRKANAIHNWFVQHVQEGEDDCGKYGVGVPLIRELVHLCERILELHSNGEHASMRMLIDAELPPTSGFFFGNTDIDSENGMNWYLEGLRTTVNQLKPLLEHTWIGESNGTEYFYGDVSYQSSW